jgi:hypothetical protein
MKMKKAIIAIALLASISAVKAEPVQPGTTIVDVIQSYKGNQLRFAQTYQGKTFNSTFVVTGVKEEIFSKGSYIMYMEAMGKTAYCHNIYDQKTLNVVGNLDNGQRVQVIGTIDDVAYGQMILKNCSIKLAN